ncbi:MAG: efflux RND transporter periplasmic adaptor subunit [Rhodomicrobium sp.]
MDEVRIRSERPPGPQRPEKEPGVHEAKPASPSAPPGRHGRGLWPILGLIIGGLLIFGVYRYLHPSNSPQPAGKPAQPPPQPVGAGAAAKGDIRIVVNALGTVTPLATVTVKTQINGQLTTVGFKEGQLVKKGDFLAQIDPRPYQLLLAQYEGQLVHDQGLLNEAKTDMIRYQALARTKAISAQIYEDQVYLVKQDEGTVKTDQALIDTEKLNLIYCHIVSPVDGRVGLRLVDPGNYVQTTDTGIAVVTQLQPMSVILPVPEDDIPEIMTQLGAGHTLQVTVFDRADVRQLDVGKVTNIDSQIDTTTGTLKLRAEFSNADLKLFPNQFVNAKLLIKTLHDVVTVPVAAVQRGAPGTYVYVINSDGTVSVRAIKLGPTDGDKAEVVSGLAAGERVVIDGADRLRNGAKVSIVQSGAATSPPGGTNPGSNPP